MWVHIAPKRDGTSDWRVNNGNTSSRFSYFQLRQDLNKTMDDLKEERVKSTMRQSQGPMKSADLDGASPNKAPRRRPTRDYGVGVMLVNLLYSSIGREILI